MQKHPLRVNIITLGCSKNISDSEFLAAKIKDKNNQVVHEGDLSQSDIVVVNTCGFIQDAKQESIDTILEIVEHKKNGQLKKVIAIGCLIERYKEDLKKEIPEVDAYYGLQEMDEFYNEFQLQENPSKQLMLSTPAHYAYLKIAEGCNRQCSFCAIPKIRGKYISKPIEVLVQEAEELASQGVKELIIIAQDTTYYGLDIYKKRKITALVQELSKIDKIQWIRLQYLYPSGFPYDLLDEMQNNPKLCKYIDIPLQHINHRILKSMQRGTSTEETLKLIKKIRSTISDVAIRTTMITGYPGETEKEFRELIDFIKEAKFDRLGAFVYSHEEDTPAFMLEDDVSQRKKLNRLDKLMQVQQKISRTLNERKIGKVTPVIIDREENHIFVCRSRHDSPDVDNEIILAFDNSLKTGDIIDVKINAADDFYLTAEKL